MIEKQIKKIQTLVVNMLKNDDTIIILKDHTNNVGETENELELSRKRALKIAFYLKDRDIDPERIQTSCFGSKMLKS